MANSTITNYHSKLFAWQLTQRVQGDDPDRLTTSIMDSSVDLNPHQIDAALFAFQSPLSRGVVLADEVGLGKTIEAGLVLSQLWAERQRRIVVITPSSLRKQWEAELQGKFHLPTMILEGASYNAIKRNSPYTNPFDQNGSCIIICSIPFAAGRADDLESVPWDMVVIDEAHRLRNSNGKQHQAIKAATTGSKKLLLTATPLQNNVTELWSLASIIDEHHFGELTAFRRRYHTGMSEPEFANLRERLSPLMQRTLRVEAREYVRFTERLPILQEFTPSDAELELYNEVTTFMQRPTLYALPNRQRHLMTMMLHKMLASSTFAIAGMLNSIATRLKRELAEMPLPELDEELGDDIDEVTSTIDEWELENADRVEPALTGEQRIAIAREIAEIEAFAAKAQAITQNAKLTALKSGLRRAFAKLEELGAERKALIFTESRRTQQYLYQELSKDPEFMNGLMLFNGSNNDGVSNEIYTQWRQKYAGTDRVTGTRSADIRAALVDHFEHNASIMIATEAAAEGVNLQFCSLVINYDLPWNPQRIEQRIGRCHRYGQKFDVVVMNFLNRENLADQRVYELLDEKFHLFSGVFGASDEVLGSIGSGVDFEKRVAAIYQQARTTQEITRSFQQLQFELFDQIQERQESTERKLFEHFDENVAERFRTRSQTVGEALNRRERMLMDLTRHELAGAINVRDSRTFDLLRSPTPANGIPTGTYQLVARKGQEVMAHSYLYRRSHPLALTLIDRARERDLPVAEVVFDYTTYRQHRRNAAVEQLQGKSGWLRALNLEITMDAGGEDHILVAGICDDGTVLDKEQTADLFRVPASVLGDTHVPADWDHRLTQGIGDHRANTIAQLEERIEAWLDQEAAKLEEWSRDRRENLEGAIDKIDKEIEALKRDNRLRGGSMAEKVERRKQISKLESELDDLEERNRLRRREISREQDALLDRAYERIHHTANETELFTIRWSIE